jgi:hypothetical protein
MLEVSKGTMRQREAAEMCCLRAAAGYRMTNHKHYEDSREEMGKMDINARNTELSKVMARSLGTNA